MPISFDLAPHFKCVKPQDEIVGILMTVYHAGSETPRGAVLFGPCGEVVHADEIEGTSDPRDTMSIPLFNRHAAATLYMLKENAKLYRTVAINLAQSNIIPTPPKRPWSLFGPSHDAHELMHAASHLIKRLAKTPLSPTKPPNPTTGILSDSRVRTNSYKLLHLSDTEMDATLPPEGIRDALAELCAPVHLEAARCGDVRRATLHTDRLSRGLWRAHESHVRHSRVG